MKKLITIILLLFSLLSFGQDGILSINGNLLTDQNGNFLNYFPVTREGLTAKFDTTYTNSNGDLINLAGGANAVYVSGTGLDKIYDFSGLNDERLNKNAYLGNSFGLPEYYDYPYTDMYFDTSNPYYWKLTDFHYANILAQTVDEDIQNVFFLKAKATTNTSNEIASVDQFIVYSSSKSDSELSQLKTWIGIQPDFYGGNLMLAGRGSFENGTDLYNSYANNLYTIPNSGGFDGNKFLRIERIDNSVIYAYFMNNQTTGLESGKIYKLSLYYKTNDATAYIRLHDGTSIINLVSPDDMLRDGDWHLATCQFTCGLLLAEVRHFMSIANTYNSITGIDGIQIRQLYQNYYAQ